MPVMIKLIIHILIKIRRFKFLIIKVKRKIIKAAAKSKTFTNRLVYEKREKPQRIIQSIKLSGLFSKTFILTTYAFLMIEEPLGITKLRTCFSTEKSTFFAVIISPSMHIGIAFSNSILK